ncbi:hypothetical protein M9978_02380 [Sphingomonas sp. MG17]|uniref:Uncharacterized protein n=1 Tax=Sphingomonas tagetis TaxID=2949092 RepID=A0A9X2HED2_9SPHN|nr:hypothetical protein [Sphingomonas tagetis]MCP3729263.1 hypothetical protein [Sphingomonas tagetis]
MARPVDFAGSNLLLTAPPGCEDRVIPLPVLRDNGQIVSCWQLSAAEIREIAETGVIWLSVWGERTAPPVLVTGLEAEVITR